MFLKILTAAMVLSVKAGILIIRLLSEIPKTGSLIRIPEMVIEAILSATCREDIVLLPAPQKHIRFLPGGVERAVAGVIPRDPLTNPHPEADLQVHIQEVHILPDPLQVHPLGLLPLALQEDEDKKETNWFFLNSSF